MANTPNYQFDLVSENETNRDLIDWVQRLSGTADTSNMMKIDQLLRELEERLDSVDVSPVTWGMLKNGFSTNA